MSKPTKVKCQEKRAISLNQNDLKSIKSVLSKAPTTEIIELSLAKSEGRIFCGSAVKPLTDNDRALSNPAVIINSVAKHTDYKTYNLKSHPRIAYFLSYLYDPSVALPITGLENVKGSVYIVSSTSFVVCNGKATIGTMLTCDYSEGTLTTSNSPKKCGTKVPFNFITSVFLSIDCCFGNKSDVLMCKILASLPDIAQLNHQITSTAGNQPVELPIPCSSSSEVDVTELPIPSAPQPNYSNAAKSTAKLPKVNIPKKPTGYSTSTEPLPKNVKAVAKAEPRGKSNATRGGRRANVPVDRKPKEVDNEDEFVTVVRSHRGELSDAAISKVFSQRKADKLPLRELATALNNGMSSIREHIKGSALFKFFHHLGACHVVKKSAKEIKNDERDGKCLVTVLDDDGNFVDAGFPAANVSPTALIPPLSLHVDAPTLYKRKINVGISAIGESGQITAFKGEPFTKLRSRVAADSTVFSNSLCYPDIHQVRVNAGDKYSSSLAWFRKTISMDRCPCHYVPTGSENRVSAVRQGKSGSTLLANQPEGHALYVDVSNKDEALESISQHSDFNTPYVVVCEEGVDLTVFITAINAYNSRVCDEIENDISSFGFFYESYYCFGVLTATPLFADPAVQRSSHFLSIQRHLAQRGIITEFDWLKHKYPLEALQTTGFHELSYLGITDRGITTKAKYLTLVDGDLKSFALPKTNLYNTTLYVSFDSKTIKHTITSGDDIAANYDIEAEKTSSVRTRVVDGKSYRAFPLTMDMLPSLAVCCDPHLRKSILQLRLPKVGNSARLSAIRRHGFVHIKRGGKLQVSVEEPGREAVQIDKTLESFYSGLKVYPLFVANCVVDNDKLRERIEASSTLTQIPPGIVTLYK